MSESIARKVQPFTIGTRLSVPVPKCQEFTQSYLQNQSLDNRSLQRNLNSLYLSRSQVCARGPCLAVTPASPEKQKEEDPAAEDHLNQNVASPSAVSRSIKKITISGNKEPADGRVPALPAEPPGRGSVSENNNNNNNVSRTSDPHLPRIVGVSCENNASSQFKVQDTCTHLKPLWYFRGSTIKGDFSFCQKSLNGCISFHCLVKSKYMFAFVSHLIKQQKCFIIHT